MVAERNNRRALVASAAIVGAAVLGCSAVVGRYHQNVALEQFLLVPANGPMLFSHPGGPASLPLACPFFCAAVQLRVAVRVVLVFLVICVQLRVSVRVVLVVLVICVAVRVVLVVLVICGT
jgi:hypothetical protein